MKGERLPPCVQYSQGTNASAKAFRIAGDDQQGLTRGREEDVVKAPRPGQGKGIQRIGHREDHVEVRHRQKLVFALLEPSLASFGLTARTMPVPARVPDD